VWIDPSTRWIVPEPPQTTVAVVKPRRPRGSERIARRLSVRRFVRWQDRGGSFCGEMRLAEEMLFGRSVERGTIPGDELAQDEDQRCVLVGEHVHRRARRAKYAEAVTSEIRRLDHMRPLQLARQPAAYCWSGRSGNSFRQLFPTGPRGLVSEG
jgi:hypothetical protein